MAPRISLALAFHNHQPVGNFGWVFEEVHDQAYRPMLDALDRHPRVRISLHYTGALLEWLGSERPEFLERLHGLAAAGRVELLGGGLFEPVLASLPEHDRVAQLRRMADEVERIAGARPSGAWLAERVWEPDLPTSLSAAGYRWTILDDAHFRAAAIPEENLWGAYTTEDQGCLLSVFGTEQGLRYRIPFGQVSEVIAHLEAHTTEDGERLGTMGDDGEKFGGWPTTYEHCWGGGRWVDDFFDALEANRSWLTTVTPSEWLDGHAPIGRVYVPTGSYAEMGEWALPPDESREFGAILHRAQAAHLPESRWLRGAFWRNFQVKYREVNDLHKQMLRTSAKVAAMPNDPTRDRAEDHLHRGQSNDSYWHGLFGGIYINHMRLATFEHLIAAEDAADAALGSLRIAERRDLDMDGRDEVLVANDGEVVSLKPDEGAGIGSWDIRAARHALCAVMRRRPEAYHGTLREHLAQAEAAALSEADAGDEGSSGVTSIHDLVRAKETGLVDRLRYDDYERRSGLVRLLPADATANGYAADRLPELGDLRDGPWEVQSLEPGRVVLARDGHVQAPAGPARIFASKTVALGGDRLAPTLTLDLELAAANDPIDAVVGVEWSIQLLGGGGNPQAWYEVDGVRSGHDGSGERPQTTAISAGNDWVGLAVRTRCTPKAAAWWYPIETISNSEAGFERVYQGSSLLLAWPLRLAPGKRRTLRIWHRVDVARDRAIEELPSERHAMSVPSVSDAVVADAARAAR